MAVARRVLLLFGAVAAGTSAAWSPQPQKYDIPLAKPTSKGKKTQVSLYPPGGPVVVLSGADVFAMNKSHFDRPVIVAMYASWCPHCWHLVPKWITFAEAYKGSKDIEVASVNCADDANRDLCDKAGVTGYPDIQCYGCPVSSTCPRNGCAVTVGFATQGLSVPKWLSNWVTNATHGSVKPTHPELLNTVEPGDGHVLIEGPPGKPGFVPSFYTPAEKRNADAMRGFLSSLWSKNDVKAALKSVRFMAHLFGEPCCHTGGMPNSLRTTAIIGLGSLVTTLEGLEASLEKRRLGITDWLHPGAGAGPQDVRQVLGQWAAEHGFANLGNQEAVAKFHEDTGVLESGGPDSFQSCTTFTCSLWSLLHLTTTSSAYFAYAGSPRLSPGEVMNFTAYFVSEFMTCKACRHHFLKSYENCEFGRCEVDRDQGWKDLVLWLWRVHQGVSLRTAARDHAPVDRRWPSYEDCQACWQPNNFADEQNANNFDMQEIGSHSKEIDTPFDLDAVYKFTVASYLGYTAGGDQAAKWNAVQPKVTAPRSSSNWLWWSFSGVVLTGVVTLFSVWTRRQGTQETVSAQDLETDVACE